MSDYNKSMLAPQMLDKKGIREEFMECYNVWISSIGKQNSPEFVMPISKDQLRKIRTIYYKSGNDFPK
jgi:hypothetical protein